MWGKFSGVDRSNMEIVVIKNDITAIEVDAVVRPAAERGETQLNGTEPGASHRILERGGDILTQALGLCLPLRIGQAAMTPAGDLPCRYVIHSAMIDESSHPPTLENIKKSILAAIRCAEDHSLRSLAFPDMGLSFMGGSADIGMRSRAARAIIAMLDGFQTSRLTRVLLVDTNEETIRAFESALEALRE